MRTTAAIPQVDRGINEATAAEILGVSVDTLRRMAKLCVGPARRRVSPKRVIYSEREVYEYREACPS
jgi:hypothetical protein